MTDTFSIRYYQEHDLDYLKKWITDSKIMFQYAGPGFNYPITEEQIKSYQSRNPERQFYMGVYEGEEVAFGEIIPQDPESVRLGRLLIGENQFRGKGIGTRFVKALLDEARDNFRVNNVDLFVLHDNLQALRCYKKAGFELLDEKNYISGPDGKRYLIFKMNRSV